MRFALWRLTNWYNSVILRGIHTLSPRDHLTAVSIDFPTSIEITGTGSLAQYTCLFTDIIFAVSPITWNIPLSSANRAGLPTLMIPTVSAYALHAPSSSPTAADLPGSCFGVGRGFGTWAHGHSSQPSITLTPDDDNERSECKCACMEGAVSVEGNSGINMGVAGTGGNEMDMTTDSEEDSKSIRRCRLLVPHTHVRGVTTLVWTSGGDGGLSGTPGAATAVRWRRGRSGSNYGR